MPLRLATTTSAPQLNTQFRDWTHSSAIASHGSGSKAKPPCLQFGNSTGDSLDRQTYNSSDSINTLFIMLNSSPFCIHSCIKTPYLAGTIGQVAYGLQELFIGGEISDHHS